jgi:hypothetical protein
VKTKGISCGSRVPGHRRRRRRAQGTCLVTWNAAWFVRTPPVRFNAACVMSCCFLQACVYD